MKFLFERLAQPPAEPTGPPPFDLEAAVRDNVRRVLNNRVLDDDGPPDVLRCGLSSVVEMAADSRPALERYGARIGALIRHYEPRLLDAHAEVEGGGGAPLRVVVSAKLARPDGVLAMRFPLTTDGDA